jgi:hypothetical protein
MDFDAALTWEQVEKCEKDDFGANRRALLATLTRSSKQLLEGFCQSKSLAVLLTTIECIQDYQAHLKMLMELSECAEARLFAVAQIVLVKN